VRGGRERVRQEDDRVDIRLLSKTMVVKPRLVNRQIRKSKTVLKKTKIDNACGYITDFA